MDGSDIPPLGKPPAFLLEDAARRAETQEKIDAVEHTTIEDHEDLASVFAELNVFAQNFRAHYGVDGPPLDPSKIRLYNEESMAELVQVLPDAENGGIYDPETGVSHIIRAEPYTQAGTLFSIYAMAHETGHDLTHGLVNDSSQRLANVAREGVADEFAREFMEHMLPKLFPLVATTTEEYLAGVGPLPVFQGERIVSRDVIYVADGPKGEEANAYSRIPEMRAMAGIKGLVGDEVFAEFMKRGLSGDTGATLYLSSQLGRGFWDQVNSVGNQLDAIDVLRVLNPELATTENGSVQDNRDRVASGEAAPLPEGYKYGRITDFSHTDLEELFRTAYSDEQVWNMYLSTRGEDLAKAGLKELDVLITNNGHLAGFATIISRGHQGEMGDLVVHPDDQHVGLARALTTERLAMAEDLEIDSLFIPPITEQNSLEFFYKEQGFTKNPDGSFMRGPDPRPVLYMPEN